MRAQQDRGGRHHVESLGDRYGAPPIRVAPFLFIRSARMLICTPWAHDRGPLSDQQREAVLAVRGRLDAEPDVPAVCWIDAECVTGIRFMAEGGLQSMAARYLMVRI
jgi:hypothetical protein